MDSSTTNPDWPPSASLDILRLRARVYRTIREFFRERNVLEVDTPVLSAAATTDPNIDSFVTQFTGGMGNPDGKTVYLSTSPEYHMKRLLASGSGSIYQLCHVFRQSELGVQHNPEFTLLEWYRVSMNYHDLMGEVAQLIELLLNRELQQTKYMTYQQAFLRHLNLDPLSATLPELRARAENLGYRSAISEDENKDVYLDYLMSHHVQPGLGDDRLCFVYEYPASQCALAQISPDDPRVSERFELFIQGVELANGYHELADAAEQQRRFEADLIKRQNREPRISRYDHRLVDALRSGLPDCSGVAVGVDRLIQLMSGQNSLAGVLAFPFTRA